MTGPELLGLAYRVVHFPGVIAARVEEQERAKKRNIRDVRGNLVEAKLVSEEEFVKEFGDDIEIG